MHPPRFAIDADTGRKLGIGFAWKQAVKLFEVVLVNAKGGLFSSTPATVEDVADLGGNTLLFDEIELVITKFSVSHVALRGW